ncbi:MAG: tetratricopeptide repeat protein [Oscillatoriales cyanobacterium]|nr:MAG: tetratricopeptide repeat protein [Oscillatoriales cyanobacterium]
MTSEIIDWDEDLPPATPEEEYESLVRTLRRTNGFRLLFVECVPSEGKRLIAKVQTDFPRKKVEVLPLNESVYNFYNLIEELPKRDEINILFVTGLEYSFDEYEREKRAIGWESKDIYSYSWRGVPPVLMNINQQRERFLDNFKICFVFLLPKFGIEYFIHRAPDFFDWRSSLFKLSMDKESLQAESMQACSERWQLEQYLALTPEARKRELVRLQGLIDEDGQTSEQKAELFFEQALLYRSAEDYAKAIASYDKALEFKPDSALDDLGRLEDAIASYDKALEFKPDKHDAWNNRGIALRNLGRLEDAIASYDKALEFKPDDTSAFYNKACCYALHSQIDQAIQNLQQAINLNPDEWREMAKTDSDFDSMRSDVRFQALIQG